jgi:hypothetical protein
MRAASPNRFSTPNPGTPTFEANSLFRKILHVSPCESRLCPVPPSPVAAKSIRTNILAPTPRKISFVLRPTNSLFHNILAIKSLESIFYELKAISKLANSFRNNILARR